MKKRLISVLLCILFMAILFPASASADTPTGIYVGGTEVRNNVYYRNDSTSGGITETGASASAYNVYCKDGVLTLKNASITKNFETTSDTAAVYSNVALIVNLIGSSTLRGADCGAGGLPRSFGICANGSLLIKGDGKLTAAGGAVTNTGYSPRFSYGMYSNIVTVESGTIGAIGGEVISGISCGMFGECVNISGGTVTNLGGSVYSGFSSGMLASDVNITGGSVANTAKAVYAGYSRGLYILGNIAIEDSKVTATGSTAQSGDTCGAFAEGSISMENGTLTAISGNAAETSYGVYAEGIAIKDSTFSATGGGAAAESYGVYCALAFTIEESSIAATGGKSSSGSSFGIYSLNDIALQDSTVTANGGEAASFSYGVYGAQASTIGKSLVTATGGKSSDGFSCGICLADNITATNSTFTVTGSDASSMSSGMSGSNVNLTNCTVTAVSGAVGERSLSCGVYGSYGIHITGGSVDSVSGTSISGNSFGMRGYQRLTIEGATVTATGGAANSGNSYGLISIRASISNSAVVSRGHTCAIMAGFLDLSYFTTPHTIVASTNYSGLPIMEYDDLQLKSYRYFAITDPYTILYGLQSEWMRGSNKSLVFTVDADYSKFVNVLIDKSVVPIDQYTVEKGSTIVTLKAEYLEKLQLGQHTIRINFADGYAQTDFTVIAAADIPDTGDNSLPFMWLGLALMAGTLLLLSAALRRRRQNG